MARTTANNDLDECINVDLRRLDQAETGKELTPYDWVILVLLGIVIPAILISMGWSR